MQEGKINKKKVRELCRKYGGIVRKNKITFPRGILRLGLANINGVQYYYTVSLNGKTYQSRSIENAISILKSQVYHFKHNNKEIRIDEFYSYLNLDRSLTIRINCKVVHCKNPEFLSLVEGAIETGELVFLDWLEENYEI